MRRTLAALGVLLLVVAGCAGGGDDTPDLDDLLVEDPVPGFERLGHDGPEDGDLDLEEVAALFVGSEEDAAGELESAGWVASSGAHWVAPAQSLVLRLDEFDTAAGAKAWVGEPAEGSTPIPGIDGARLTKIVHEGRIGRPVADYRSAAYQRLAIGQVCRYAVVVFLRSAEETLTDRQLTTVFRRQARAVEPYCDDADSRR